MDNFSLTFRVADPKNLLGAATFIPSYCNLGFNVIDKYARTIPFSTPEIEEYKAMAMKDIPDIGIEHFSRPGCIFPPEILELCGTCIERHLCPLYANHKTKYPENTIIKAPKIIEPQFNASVVMSSTATKEKLYEFGKINPLCIYSAKVVSESLPIGVGPDNKPVILQPDNNIFCPCIGCPLQCALALDSPDYA